MNLKPHKKVFATAFFLLVFLGGVFAYAQKNSSPRETQNLVVTAGAAGESDEWKKTLSTIGASANTSEGFLFASSSAYDATIPETPENLSNTDVLGRKLFLSYAELSKQGEVTPAAAEKIAQEIASAGLASTTLKARQYTILDIRVLYGATKQDTATYRTKLNETIAKYATPTLGAELEQVKTALVTKDPGPLVHVEKAHASYTAITKALLTLSVPENLAPIHLNLLNSYSTLAASSEAMSLLFVDPLPSLSAIEAYRTASAIIIESLQTKVAL